MGNDFEGSKKMVWKDVKRVRKGEQARDEMVKDINCQILHDGVDVRRRWAEYFEQVLNVADVTETNINEFLLLLLFRVHCARPGESENTLSVPRPQSHVTNRWKEEEEETDKTVGYTKERADHANRRALALLLKHASPTPSNKVSLRSFQRDTERGNKGSAILICLTMKRRE